MPSRPDHCYTQSAVIPHRRRDGQLEILLITSRRSKRWVVPKGVVEPELSPAESAAKEAREEAGIEGPLSPDSIGRFTYEKWGGVCDVEVFSMAVETVLDRWPEDYRRRAWLAPTKAARRVDEPALARLINEVARTLESAQRGKGDGKGSS